MLNAWIPTTIQQNSYKSLVPRLGSSKLSARSDEQNSHNAMPTNNNIFYANDIIINRKHDNVVRVVGIFESLMSLPVVDWEDNNNIFEEGEDWINVCRDDDCEQCPIPEDYHDPSVQLNVLDILGIRRAEPLHIKRKTNEG